METKFSIDIDVLREKETVYVAKVHRTPFLLYRHRYDIQTGNYAYYFIILRNSSSDILEFID